MCDDGEPCTEDSCAAGLCVFLPAGDGSECAEDGLVCTQDLCSGGLCVHPPAENGLPCDDGEDCSVEDHCWKGTCTAGGYADTPVCMSACGDGICAYPDSAVIVEGLILCPQDCGWCGDGVCGVKEAGANGGQCPADCLTTCGNGKC